MEILREPRLELVELFRSPEALVESKRREDDVDFLPREVLRNGSEIVGSGLQVHLVARPSEIPDDEVEVGMRLIKHRLKNAMTTRLFEETIPDEGDPITFLQFQRQRRHDRLAFYRERRRLRVDAVFRQGGIGRRGLLAGRLVLRVGGVDRKRAFGLGRSSKGHDGESQSENTSRKNHVG